MVPDKLKIYIETGPDQFKEHLEALFNPNQISMNKTSRWTTRAKGDRDTAKSRFAYGEPITLSMELFFDTYAERKNVTDYTSKLFELTVIEKHGDLHRPSLCQIGWGSFHLTDEFTCSWILQSLNQRYTLFLEDGRPARATASCSFRQWRTDDIEAKLLGLKSVDVPKRRMVRRGDTLSSIAAEQYNDPHLWRAIAEANAINNPRRIAAGDILAIPALRSRRFERG